MSGESLADSFRRVAAAGSSPAIPRAFGQAKATHAVKPKMLLDTAAPVISRPTSERPKEPEGPPPRRLRVKEPEGPPPRHILEQHAAKSASSSDGSGIGRSWPPPTPPRRPRPSSASSVPEPASPKPSASPSLRPSSMRSPPLDVEDEPEIIGVHPGTVSPAVVSSDPLRKLFIWSTGHFVTPPIPDEIQEAQTHQIILDARWIHNPAYGALGRYHSGRHPGIFNGIYAVPGVLTWAVKALVEARQFSLVDIKVMCSAGRHRSVAIAELLKAVAAQTLHAEVEILFLHWAKVQGGWRHLCAPCAVCAGFQAHEDFKYYVQEAVAEYQRLTAAAYKDPFVLDVDCRGQLEWNPPSLLICSGDVAAMPSQGTQQWFQMQGKVKSFTHIFCFGKIISCCFLIMGFLQMRCNCTQPIFTANNNKVFNQQIFRSRRKSNPTNFTLLHLSQCTGKERWSSCSDQRGYEDHTMTTASIAATQVRNYHDKARGKTVRDSLRQHAQGARFRGGAIPWVGLLICSRRACVDICADMDRHPFMQPCWQSVGLHASAGRNTSCSFGLNSSQATNCISTGKVLDFDFWQFENNQMEWKGTVANHFDWQISDLSKHNILHTSNVCFRDWLMHKFCPHIHNNFRTFPHISDWMALADQVRRVAQAENYALPRAWRGRSGNVGNLVPRILERPTAKARLNPPVPSRSPDLDLARAVVQQVEEAPTIRCHEVPPEAHVAGAQQLNRTAWVLLYPLVLLQWSLCLE